MKWRRPDRRLLAPILAAMGMAGAAVAVGTVFSLPSQDDFPHADHAGLFPACEACHAGVPDGRAEAFYSVTASDCASCHDGDRLDRVEWRPPPVPRASNLDFSHPVHRDAVRQTEQTALDCADCHRIPGAPGRMDVASAAVESCLGCHAHEAPVHLAEGVACTDCHLSLARAEGISTARLAAFPEPADHDAEDFIWRHGGRAEVELARCAVCHARESCTRCHLNADRLPAVTDLSRDDRVATLMADEAGRWPVPPTHLRPDWMRAHGVAARADVQSCANCHAASSCEACHGEARVPVIAGLPRPGPEEAPGVRVRPTRPPGHTADFFRSHGTAAAADLPSCASCHTERQCAACHLVAVGERGAARPADYRPPPEPASAPRARPAVRLASLHGRGLPRDPPGPAVGASPAIPAPTDTVRETDREEIGAPREGVPPRRLPAAEEGGFTGAGFHPPNFVLRHGAEAFAAGMECAECHSREAFCRSCHTSLGMAAERGFITGAFHDGQPDWLLAHARAARQNMELCASCHQQTSCLRCHSARVGWGVNPHGPGFDPGRVGDRSRMSCGACHFAGQLDPP